MSELVRRKQKDLWARAVRTLLELERAAPILREDLDAFNSLEEYQRSMFITHCLDLATELADYAEALAMDLQRVSWLEEIE